MSRTDSEATVKPLLRGWSHLVAFACVAVAGPLLAMAAPSRARLHAAIYFASLAALFGVSALYHRPNWSPPARAWMRRLDHSAIFVFIAGTYTPLALGLKDGTPMLLVVWIGAAIGLLRAILWVTAPKPLIAVTYIALGWSGLWFVPELAGALGLGVFLWVAVGGVLYTLGAVTYALKKPNPWPAVFGYHEVFHLLVILAAASQYVGVRQALAQAGQ